MKRVYVLALRDDFDESKNLINIQLEDVNTGEEHGFRSLIELHKWLNGVANHNPRQNEATRRP
jgi:hypothetical protein